MSRLFANNWDWIEIGKWEVVDECSSWLRTPEHSSITSSLLHNQQTHGNRWTTKLNPATRSHNARKSPSSARPAQGGGGRAGGATCARCAPFSPPRCLPPSRPAGHIGLWAAWGGQLPENGRFATATPRPSTAPPRPAASAGRAADASASRWPAWAAFQQNEGDSQLTKLSLKTKKNESTCWAQVSLAEMH